MGGRRSGPIQMGSSQPHQREQSRAKLMVTPENRYPGQLI